jgi:hypothetical protein
MNTMERLLHWLSALDWVAVSSLAIAVISFFVAKKTLDDAEEYWKQQKWFDIYVKADQAYNDLDRYRTIYKGVKGVMTTQQETDWNNLMFSIRNTHTMAAVFPKCIVIDKLFVATDNFEDASNAFEDERMPQFLDAVESLRRMARLNPVVLELKKLPE